MPKSIINLVTSQKPTGCFLMVVFLFAVIAICNIHPQDYLFSLGDFYELINFSEKSAWFTNTYIDAGEGSINHHFITFYYSFFSWLKAIFGANYSGFYSFSFLMGAFVSFGIALKLYCKIFSSKPNYLVIFCFAFLYAVNAYTCFNRFNLPSLFFSPYLFIPIIFATAHYYFLDRKLFGMKLIWSSVVLLFSNICWVNPSYFSALVILLMAYVLLMFFVWKPYPFNRFFIKCIIFGIISLISFLWLVLPLIPILFGHISGLQTESGAMIQWIASQAVPVYKVFSLGERYLHNLSFLESSLMSVISFLFIFLFLISVIASKPKDNKKTIFFCLMLLFIAFLLNKGNGFPFNETLYSFFNSNPLLASIRSYDKVLIFLPFFLLLPCGGSNFFLKKGKLLLVFVLLSLICLYPTLNGDLFKKHTRPIDEDSDYLKSKYAPFVKIPGEYFQLFNFSNQTPDDHKLMAGPWALPNPDLLGWSFFPKWKSIGVNPLEQFFNHPQVNMNRFGAFGHWNYGKFWNDQTIEESKWLLKLAGMLNAKYFLYHLDVPDEFVDRTIDKIDAYSQEGLLHSIFENEFFRYFEIDEQYFLPHLYIPEKIVTTNRIENMPHIIQSEKSIKQLAIVVLKSSEDTIKLKIANNKKPLIEYKKVNPSKYIVKFRNISESFPFVFSEMYNPHWRIYPKAFVSKKMIIEKKYIIRGASESTQATYNDLNTYIRNGWLSEVGDGKQKLKEHIAWFSINSKEKVVEKYHVDYISKIFDGTIQNNNINIGADFDTLFLEKADFAHFKGNGYANLWIFDFSYLKENFSNYLKTNEDGSYNLEVIMEFYPQQQLFIGKTITMIFAFFIFVILGINFILTTIAKLKNQYKLEKYSIEMKHSTIGNND